MRLGVHSGGSVPAPPETVQCSFEDASTWNEALTGCEDGFLLRPPALADMGPMLVPFVRKARACGVRHIVFVSVLGAERMRWVPHWRVDQALRAGPCDWTILRAGFFAQNVRRPTKTTSSLTAASLCRRARTVWPSSTPRTWGRRPWPHWPTHRAGVARLRCSRGHGLSASTNLRKLWGAAVGQPVRYVPASIPNYLWHLVHARKLPLAHALVQTVLHVGLRRGDASGVDATLADLLGRKPTDVTQVVRRMVQSWHAAGLIESQAHNA